MKGSYAIIKKTTRVAAPVVRCQYDERGQYRQLFSTWIIADSAEKIQNEILNLKWWKIYISSWKNYTSCEENCPWNYKNASFVISVHDEEVFMPYKTKANNKQLNESTMQNEQESEHEVMQPSFIRRALRQTGRKFSLIWKSKCWFHRYMTKTWTQQESQRSRITTSCWYLKGRKAAHRPERLLQHLVG